MALFFLGRISVPTFKMGSDVRQGVDVYVFRKCLEKKLGLQHRGGRKIIIYPPKIQFGSHGGREELNDFPLPLSPDFDEEEET